MWAVGECGNSVSFLPSVPELLSISCWCWAGPNTEVTTLRTSISGLGKIARIGGSRGVGSRERCASHFVLECVYSIEHAPLPPTCVRIPHHVCHVPPGYRHSTLTQHPAYSPHNVPLMIAGSNTSSSSSRAWSSSSLTASGEVVSGGSGPSRACSSVACHTVPSTRVRFRVFCTSIAARDISSWASRSRRIAFSLIDV